MNRKESLTTKNIDLRVTERSAITGRFILCSYTIM